MEIDVFDAAANSNYVGYIHFGCYVEHGRELSSTPEILLP